MAGEPGTSLPPPPCATAESEDRDNRSRHERRSLRWVAADAETLCCAFARSVVEVTRETTVLRGRHKGHRSVERVVYVSSVEFDPARAPERLRRIRDCWDIEGGLPSASTSAAGRTPAASATATRSSSLASCAAPP